MKSNAILRIVIWALVALLLLGILLAGIQGGYPGLSLNIADWFSLRGTGNSNGYFSKYENEAHYTIGAGSVDAAGITELEIYWLDEQVDIVSTQGSTIEFFETSAVTLDTDFQMRYYQQGSKLIIQYAKSLANLRLVNNARKHLTVSIPATAHFSRVEVSTVSAGMQVEALQADTVYIETVSGAVGLESILAQKKLSVDGVSGKIHMAHIQSGDIDIDGVSGNVTAQHIQASRVQINMISGTIDLEDCTAEQLEIDTTSGRVHVDANALGQANITTLSGSVVLATASAPHNIDIETTSGSIELAVPSSISGFTVRHDTGSGKFKSDFPITLHNGTSYYGDGSASICFDTLSGNCKIVEK